MSSKFEKVQPEVGMILVSSWGYDQTNIDFYKIVKVSAKSVWIQAVGKKIVDVVHWAGQTVVPSDEVVKVANGWDENDQRIWEEAPVMRKVWKDCGVAINSFSAAYVWDGRAETQTQTA